MFAVPIGVACSAGGDGSGATGGRPGSGGADGGGYGGSSATGVTGGTSASSGSSGNGGLIFDMDGSGAGGGTADACAGSSYRGEQKPLDMYIMFDQSGSMNDSCCNNSNRWDAIKNALITFVQSPQSNDVGIGIQYFPQGAPQVTCVSNDNPPGCVCPCFFGFCLPCYYNGGGSSCVLADYATPDVPIQLLPGVAPAIVSSLNAHSPNGGTPTFPALEGAVQYASAYAAQNPGRKTIVVLATDGAPNDCNSNVGNVAQAAATGYAANPSIQTFVIGVGNTGNLDQIAQSGGSGQALVVGNANAGDEFLAAMNSIRGMALECDFSIPLPENEEPNFDQVNVRHTPEGAPDGNIIYKVASEAECDATLGGWFYDDPSAPQNIRLCPLSCDLIKTEQGQVDIEIGCDTVPIPPR